MRKLLLLVAFVVMLTEAGAQTKKEILVTIKNPRKTSGGLSETISISWKAIITKMPGLKGGNLKLYDEQEHAEVPYQLEYSGLNEPQSLLLKASVPAGKSIQFRITEGKPPLVTPKVYGRYVPERMDDFAWENDKIAFRMYGKALEATNENAFGLDVWAKRTDKMVVDKWYKTGDYHADHGDGLDFYHVGFTLGAGDIAPIIDSKILFPKNYRTWEILDNGPLRFAFVLKYDEWDVAGRVVKASKHYTLDAGSQLNRVEATFTFDAEKGPLRVATGIVLRKEQNPDILKDKNGIAGYWEPEHGADGTLGIGTIMMKEKPEVIIKSEHLLTLVNAASNKPVVYYNGAAWSKGGKIISSKQWFSYLEDFRQTLIEPLIITLK
ncbi:hypothetical protein ACVWYN_000997 [Pedobacter sp. UYP24]